MLPFATAYVEWVAATLLPAVFGVLVAFLLRRWLHPRYVASAGVGVFLWFFVDTMQGSSDLYVGSGFVVGYADQILAVALFLGGLLLFFALGGALRVRSEGGLVAAALAAFALGIHGFGEGSAFGHVASVTQSTDVLQAFGGATAGLSYAFHKALEPLIVGAIYLAGSGGSVPLSRGLRDSVTLGAVFAIPSAVGAATGYFFAYAATYGFALGAGASVLVGVMLFAAAKPLSDDSGSLARSGLAVTVGFILIYLAAYLHS